MRSFQFSCLQAIAGWPRAQAAERYGCTFGGGIAGGTSSADRCAAVLLGRSVQSAANLLNVLGKCHEKIVIIYSVESKSYVRKFYNSDAQ